MKRSIAEEERLVNHDLPCESYSRRPAVDDVRIGMMLANAVIHAGQVRSTGYRNRTVGDLFDCFIRMGLKLDDEIGMVDFGASDDSGYLRAERGHDGRWEVRGIPRGQR